VIPPPAWRGPGDELIPGHGGLHHSQALEPEIQTRIKDQVSELQADGLEAEYELRQVVTRNPAQRLQRQPVRSTLTLLSSAMSKTAILEACCSAA
jgi:hypothetical protein